MSKAHKTAAFMHVERLVTRTSRVVFGAALLLVGLAFASSVASATTFNVSAVVGDEPNGEVGPAAGLTLKGTLQIDTAGGSLDSGSLTLQNDPNVFTGFFGCPTSGTCTFYFNSGFAEFGLLDLTNAGTLVGYAGGPILPDSYIDTASILQDLTGTVTPAAIPEPSSLMLLGTGAASFAGLFRRKLRK
jgi:hypothetical protein